MKRYAVPVLLICIMAVLSVGCENSLVVDCYNTLASAQEVYTSAWSMSREIYNNEMLTEEQREAFRSEMEPLLVKTDNAITVGWHKLAEYSSEKRTTADQKSDIISAMAEVVVVSSELVTGGQKLNPEWSTVELYTFKKLEKEMN